MSNNQQQQDFSMHHQPPHRGDSVSESDEEEEQERRGGPRMGRKKIKIEKISDSKNRQVTFNKRKVGLLKKAIELSVLCDCEVSLLIFHSDKLYEYSSKPLGQCVQKYLDYEGSYEVLDNTDLHNLRPGKASSIRIGRKQKFASFEELLAHAPAVPAKDRSKKSVPKKPSPTPKTKEEFSSPKEPPRELHIIPSLQVKADEQQQQGNPEVPKSRKRKPDEASPYSTALSSTNSVKRLHRDDGSDYSQESGDKKKVSSAVPVASVDAPVQQQTQPQEVQQHQHQQHLRHLHDKVVDSRGSPMLSTGSFDSGSVPQFTNQQAQVSSSSSAAHAYVDNLSAQTNLFYITPRGPDFPSNFQGFSEPIPGGFAPSALHPMTLQQQFHHSMQSSISPAMGYSGFNPNQPQPVYYYHPSQADYNAQPSMMGTSTEPQFVIVKPQFPY
eukprot:TRINITY_DN5658_c0_g2_i1.p1 TRINITY_DN5658_c0_g2~~TRINITY_DN5658_c0_g2_i1.p1  ORF type:complete len:440 (+),score=88.22 TRINITY_DN5658_c0_g2_i1:65-1384(+)